MSFWEVHGYLGGLFFIIFLLLLPRTTILFSVSISAIVAGTIVAPLGIHGFLGGTTVFLLTFIGWVIWLFFPRLLIAIFATLLYPDTNVVLLAGAWLIAYATFRFWKEFIPRIMAKLQETVAEAAREHEKYAYAKAQSGSFRQAPRTQSRMQRWWEVLNVSKDASIETINAAFRRKAKETHPDMPLGNAKSFQQVKEAYEEGKRQNRTR